MGKMSSSSSVIITLDIQYNDVLITGLVQNVQD